MTKPKPPEQKSLVGYTIGKCKLLRICGRGAMGTVYKGLHQGLDIDVAVKILPPHLACNSTLVERFAREAKLAARLNHANTVRVYDVGEESGYHFLVMEFVEGTDALQLIKKYGPQKAHVVADIGAGCARALAHAHESDVVHRDIKPANLMLPENGGVKVADFGLARALASDSGLTMTGSIMGTPDYMAPEQAQGEPAGAPADIYALGATLYHLFVGKPPFRGDNPMAVALQHVTGRIVVPEELVSSNTDRALVRIIHECTQKEVAERPDNLHSLERQLMKIARSTQHTQKLMSEGATLFSTTGYKLDIDAITKQKEIEATSAISDMGGVESPHLESLRKAAEKARGKINGHGLDIQPPNATPPSSSISQDLAELTGDMVREAKARSRRSSGQIASLPANDSKTDAPRMSSNPAMSPHRDETSAASSRRSKVVTDPNLDDDAWESYAAKSFPTFEKTGEAPSAGTGPSTDSSWDGGQTASSSVNPTSLGYSGPANANQLDDTPQYQARVKKKSPVGIIATVLLLGLIVGGILHFGGFLDDADNNTQASPVGNSDVAELKIGALEAPPHAESIYAVIRSQKTGRAFVGDSAGNILQFDAKNKFSASTKVDGRILTITEHSGRTLAVGTENGRLFLLSSSSLQSDSPELVLSLRGISITAITHFDRRFVVGDSSGYIRFHDGSEPLKISEGHPVVGMFVVGKKLWVVAGERFAQVNVKNGKLNIHAAVNLKGQVTSMTRVASNVYIAIANELAQLTPSGGIRVGIRLDSPYISGDHSQNWVSCIQSGKVIFYSPIARTITGRAALPSGFKVESIGPGRSLGEVIIGSDKGQLITVKP